MKTYGIRGFVKTLQWYNGAMVLWTCKGSLQGTPTPSSMACFKSCFFQKTKDPARNADLRWIAGFPEEAIVLGICIPSRGFGFPRTACLRKLSVRVSCRGFWFHRTTYPEKNYLSFIAFLAGAFALLGKHAPKQTVSDRVPGWDFSGKHTPEKNTSVADRFPSRGFCFPRKTHPDH